jgi:hypothetical protein
LHLQSTESDDAMATLASPDSFRVRLPRQRDGNDPDRPVRWRHPLSETSLEGANVEHLRPNYLRDVAYISRDWIEAHGLHPAVGVAIEVAAEIELPDDRAPSQIVEAPTVEERDIIERLVRTYIASGVFPPSADNTYGFADWQFTVDMT